MTEAEDDLIGPQSLAGAEWITGITDEGIIAVCGTRAYERGLGYLDAERVRSVSTGDRGRMVLAVVDGSRSRPYSVMVMTTGGQRGGEPDWSGRCSCPVQIGCKHVVATVLTVRHALGGPDTERDRWDRVLDAVLTHTEPSATSAVAKTADGVAAADTPTVGIAIAVVPDPEFPSRRDIQLRPTRMTRAGAWHRTSSWSDFVDRGSRAGVTAAQTDLLVAIHRMRPNAPWHSSSGVLLLSRTSPVIWDLLAAAEAAGIALIAEPGRNAFSQVQLLDPTDLSVTVDADGDDLSIGAGLPGVTGTPLLLGDPPRGLAVQDGDTLLLARLRSTPEQVVSELAQRDSPLRVPAEQVPEFESVYLPALRAAAPVRRDGAELDEDGIAPIRLALNLIGRPGPSIEVEAHFRYGDIDLPVDLEVHRPGRRRREERALVEGLTPVLRGLKLVAPVGGLGFWPRATTRLGGLGAIWLLERLEELRARPDLDITVGDLPGFEEIDGEPTITLKAGRERETDWLDLHIEITVDDELVPFEPLFEALVRGDEALVLDSGSWFRLDHPSLHRLRDLIAESRQMAEPTSGVARLNRHHLSLWTEMADLGVADEQAQSWREAVSRLMHPDALARPEVPTSITATLRPYQHDGFAWLSALWDADLGGVLADDMGLGKTVQILSLLARAQEVGQLDEEPVLVVAPTSVISAWTEQAARFAPDLKLAVVTSTGRSRGLDLATRIAGAHLVLTTYTVLRLDDRAFQSRTWRGIVCDEAQAVKNHRTKTHHAVRRVSAPFRLVVSGTPLENSLMDLWALMAIAAPGLFPDPDVFGEQYRKPIELGSDPQALEQLRRRVRPLLLRRTKEDVAPDLPPKQVQVSHLPLTSAHERVYEAHLQRERQRVLGLLEEPEANRVAILAALTRLRQLALDPALVDDTAAVGRPAKAAALVEQLRELAAEGHRALVFSQFTRYLGVLRETLAEAGLSSVYLDGSMSAGARAGAVEEFRTGEAPAFLISLKAGGTGLTLTEADYVFVMDPWWNPAVEAQAIDRAHRIGQDKPVMVYRMVSAGTIEEKVVQLAERKQDLFDQVVGEAALGGSLSAEDIRGLLEI
ncbi:SNF2-related protein [Dermacoccaceae bacterium W4C1]